MAFTPDEKKGFFSALFCYAFWGLLPIFWKLLSAVPALDIQVQRMIWCFVCILIFCAVRKRKFAHLFKDRRARLTFALSATLVTINWTTYVIAVSSGNIVESALGYYINPLMNFLIGVVFFHEKLTPVQAIAVMLAVIGVAYFTAGYGHFPYYAIILATSFALYGAVKKWGKYDSAAGMAVESTFTGVVGLIAFVVSLCVPGLFASITPVTAADPIAVTSTAGIVVLFILSGFVTWLPLQLFSEAANKIPLVMIGFIQYLSPTIALMVGVFLFGEPFTFAHAFCFGCIWFGILLTVIDAIRRSRKEKAQA